MGGGGGNGVMWTETGFVGTIGSVDSARLDDINEFILAADAILKVEI